MFKHPLTCGGLFNRKLYVEGVYKPQGYFNKAKSYKMGQGWLLSNTSAQNGQNEFNRLCIALTAHSQLVLPTNRKRITKRIVEDSLNQSVRLFGEVYDLLVIFRFFCHVQVEASQGSKALPPEKASALPKSISKSSPLIRLAWTA